MTFSQKLAKFITKRPLAIIAMFAFALLMALPVVGQLYLFTPEIMPLSDPLNDDPLIANYFDDYNVLNEKFGGVNFIFVPCPVKNAASVFDVEAIRELYAVSQELEKNPHVVGTFSLANVIMVVNKLVTQSYSFPAEGTAGDQQIALYASVAEDQSGAAMEGALYSPDQQCAMMLVIMEKGQSLMTYREWVRELTPVIREVADNNPHTGALEFYPVSVDVMYLEIDGLVATEGVLWIAVPLLGVIVCMFYLFKDPREVIIPLLVITIALVFALATFKLLGEEFSQFAMPMVALSLGAGISYALYVISRYREERALGSSSELAIERIVANLGPATLVTALTTVLGFFSLWFCNFHIIMVFGFATAVSLILILLGCFLMIPAFLHMFYKNRTFNERHAKQFKEQQSKVMKGIIRFAYKNPIPIFIVIILVCGIFGYGVYNPGIKSWDTSYTSILGEDKYGDIAFEVLCNDFGYPEEGVVIVRGDITDPAKLAIMTKLCDKFAGDEKFKSIESPVKLLKSNYLAATNTASLGQDVDQNGIPDSKANVIAGYNWLYTDPASKVSADRVLDYVDGQVNTNICAIRVVYDVEGGSPIENRRVVMDYMLDDLREIQAENPSTYEYSLTGHLVGIIALIDSVDFGQMVSMFAMLGMVFVVILLFFKNPVVALIVEFPVMFGVLMQSGITAYLGYQVQYLFVIGSAMITGLGTDYAVQIVNRFREEMRSGKTPEESMEIAGSTIGKVLIASILTTASALIMPMFSGLKWAGTLAGVAVPTIFVIFIFTLLYIPPAVVWHAKHFPAAYIGKKAAQEFKEKQRAAAEAAQPALAQVPEAIPGRVVKVAMLKKKEDKEM
jgi:predicted RND superfamily exporter protein